MNQNNDLERLRNLLFKEEQQTVAELKQRLSNRYQRTQDIAEVLCDAVRLTERQENSELADALRSPVEDAVKASLRQDRHQLAEILYPAIFPSIRRSIAETMRQYVERIDTLVTQNFSLRSIQWRFQSWRTGVPLSDIVLRDTIVYQAEQLLLIQNSTGLLMQHVHLDQAMEADSDAVTGMLWAIEAFVRDSFTGDDQEGLNRVTMGDYTIYLVHGPKATIACVIKGVSSPEYLDRVRGILEKIHALKSYEIEHFNGDQSSFSATRPMLEEGLETVYRQDFSGKLKKKGIFLLVIGLLIIGLMVIPGWLTRHRVHQLVSELDSQPGILVSRVDRANGGWQIQGLADPVSIDPETLLSRFSLDPDQVRFGFSPFLSLEPSIMKKRLRQQLHVPDTVEFTQEKGVVRFAGKDVPVDWFRSIATRNVLPAGVSGFDFSAVSLSADEVVANLRHTLPLPGSVSVKAMGDLVELEGRATGAWIQSLENYIRPFSGLIGFERSRLLTGQSDVVPRLVASLEKHHVFYPPGQFELTPEGESTLQQVIQIIRQLQQKVENRGEHLLIRVTGTSDPTGAEAVNSELRKARAQGVIDYLVTKGIAQTLLVIGTQGKTETPGRDHLLDDQARQVYFRTEINR